MSLQLSDVRSERYGSILRSSAPLERSEELALFRRFRAGDARAGDRLVRALLPSVHAVAWRYRRYGVSPGELVAEGNFGLVRALGKFDPGRGTRLMTYAVHWVRAYVIDYVIRSYSLVSGGSGALRSRFFFKLRRERARLRTALGEGEGIEAVLAERLGVGRGRVSAMLRRLDSRDVSIDAPVGAGPGTLGERLPANDDQECAFEREQTRAILNRAIRSAVVTLDARERYIVEHRLMADHEDEVSLAEIGRKLGVSRERARQLEQRAKKKLRTSITAAPAAAALA